MKTSNTDFLEIAIWEFTSDRELQPLRDLIRRKYNYLTQCRTVDLFSLSEVDAQKMHNRIQTLEKEVEVMYAAKNMIDRLRPLYMNATADIAETIRNERRVFLETALYWKERFKAEHDECISEKREVLFWMGQAQKYLHNGKSR